MWLNNHIAIILRDIVICNMIHLVGMIIFASRFSFSPKNLLKSMEIALGQIVISIIFPFNCSALTFQNEIIFQLEFNLGGRIVS